jgi:dehydrogenase/reductase SDR family member 1
MRTALVTGASRGVGHGVALGLAAADFAVYATGRSIESADLPASIVRLRCDHTRDDETARVFQRISEDAGGLDIAAPIMIQQRKGLIVNISFWAAQKYVGNSIYGISKSATDKMSADMAHELRPHGVAAVSLYPGLVRTEAVMAAAQGGWLDISNSESPEFIGRGIAALSSDPRQMERSGQAVIAAQIAKELNVFDTDGKQPIPLTLETV